MSRLDEYNRLKQAVEDLKRTEARLEVQMEGARERLKELVKTVKILEAKRKLKAMSERLDKYRKWLDKATKDFEKKWGKKL